MRWPDFMNVVERGWLSSNAVLFHDASGLNIVDTGYVSHAALTLALVQQTGRPLRRIVNTHLHSDHCGGNAVLQAAFPASRTAIPAAEASKVRTWDEVRLSYRATGQQCPRFDFTETLADGDVIELGGKAWQVHAAPGHDPHALMLFQLDEGVLISADALWEDGFGVIFPELQGEPGFEPALAALRCIERLRPRSVIPGHGAPFTDVQTALRRAYSRLDYLAADPRRNAQHALRVLMKFKLLDAQRLPRDELSGWMSSLPYFATIHRRFFADAPAYELVTDCLHRLLRAGACELQGDSVVDAG